MALRSTLLALLLAGPAYAADKPVPTPTGGEEPAVKPEDAPPDILPLPNVPADGEEAPVPKPVPSPKKGLPPPRPEMAPRPPLPPVPPPDGVDQAPPPEQIEMQMQHPKGPGMKKGPLPPPNAPGPMGENIGGPEMFGVPKKAKAPAKEMTPCAKSVLPLADSYRKAAEDLDRWVLEIDSQMSASDAAVKKLENQVEANEAKITKLRLHEDASSQSERRDLERENRQLWSDLKTARKERDALCQGFAKTAAQKVREFGAEIADRLKQIQSQSR